MSNSPTSSLPCNLNAKQSTITAIDHCFSVRYYIAFLGFISSAIMFAVRCNLSVAIIAMVNDDDDTRRAFPLKVNNQTQANTTIELKVKLNDQLYFDWTAEEQGIVLGSYYYGYALVQIISGLIADKYDPVHLAVGTHTVASLLTLLTPLAAFNGLASLSIVRGLLGLAHAPMLSYLYALYSHWFPMNEISLPLCLMQAGSNIGIALIMPLTAFFCESITFGGWPSAFYFIGLVNLLLPVVWMTTVTSNPTDHPWISEREKSLLLTSQIKKSKAKVTVYWKKIFTSIALWSLVLSRTGQSLFYMIITTKIPAYFESVLGISLYSNGVCNSFLYLAIALSQLISGPLAKYIIDKGFLRRTVTRKVFETQALLIPCICLMIIPLIDLSSDTVMILLIVSCFFMGFVCGGHMPIVSEMSPELSGTIFGITNLAASSMGFLAPMAIGVMLDSDNDKVTQWNIVFYSSALFMLTVNITFVLFATSQRQPWSSSSHDNLQIEVEKSSNLSGKINISPGNTPVIAKLEEQVTTGHCSSPILHHIQLGSYFNFEKTQSNNLSVDQNAKY